MESTSVRWFSSRVFLSFLDFIKDDIRMVVKNFFQTHHFPTQLNHTLLLPVPKRAGAQRVHDFRPIILCSVLYKIISKLLAYRLKGVIAKCIQGNQSAFVAGRQSCDNVIHGHECLRSVMSRKKLP